MVQVCWLIEGSLNHKDTTDLTLANSRVSDAKAFVAGQIGLRSGDLVVSFGGNLLADDHKLIDVPMLREDSTLMVFKNPKPDYIQPVSLRDEEIEMLLMNVHTVLRDRQHRDMLFDIISNPDRLANLIAVTPGLREDLAAQGVLKSPLLLLHWLTSKNLKKVLNDHPCLIEATQHILVALHEEVMRSSGGVPIQLQRVNMPGRFFDPMLSDEEGEETNDDEEMPDAGEAPATQRRPIITPRQITQNQLAQALAAATAAAGNPQAQAGPSVGRGATVNPFGALTRPQSTPTRHLAPRSAAGRGALTSNMLQQAMQQALAPQSPQYDTPEKLQQLREMGFVNDDENSQALRVTRGNVDAALEWIINDRESRGLM